MYDLLKYVEINISGLGTVYKDRVDYGEMELL